MTGTEIYKRTDRYEKESLTIRLHAPQWKLLLAFDGQRTLSEVALSAETSFADALPLTERFLAHGWIEEQPITLDQYLKRTGATNVAAIGASVPPAVVLHEPKPVATEPPPAPKFVPVPPPLATPIPAPAVAPPAAPVPAPTPRTGHGPMRLSAVVDYITSLVGNVAVGQLLVYRVFLRVPPDLLQAEDITSVHLANDTSLIRTEALQKAIADAVREVAKRPLPDGVYAAA